MRRNLFTMLLCVMPMLMSLSLKASPVDSTYAKNMAVSFFQSFPDVRSRSLAPSVAYTGLATRQEGTRNVDQPLYYVVNVGTNAFAIVAADSRVSPILAYSTTSSFDGSRIPENMAFLLGEYQQQIELICEASEEPAPSVEAAWEALRHPSRLHSRSVVVEPLLTSKWNQYPYYNALCPADIHSSNGHASTGCTAVAMGQVMRYWNYPVQGVGSHSYLSNNSHLGIGYGDYGMLSADFANTTYDYDNMPDSLSASSSPAEINAVATLLYHCGVSLNTAYGVVSSSAYISGVDDALRNYFDYDSTIIHIYRSVFTETSWLNRLKNELNQLRPVIYTGAGAAVVHAFVCDGYDDQNFFHMNWGWGGYADGFYLLTNLSPNVNSYNTAQTAIINIVHNPPLLNAVEEELTFFQEEGQPAEIQKVNVTTVDVEDVIDVTVNGNFSLSLDSVNFGNHVVLPALGGSFFVKYASQQEVSTCDRTNVMLTSGIAMDTVRLIGLNYMPACHAPLSIYAEQGTIDAGTDTNQVMITWQAPIPDMTIASWDSVPNTSMGDQYPYVIIPLHRLEESDLLPFHKHILTQVSFIADASATEYHVVVYKGGGLSDYGRRLDAGTKILDKPLNLSELTMGGWNTVTLDTPIVIDASQELWYGLYIAAPANTAAVKVGGSECVPFKGNIYGYDFAGEVFWYPYSDNFVLKATIDNPFIQYEVYRNDSLLTTMTSDTSYADYPPVYAHYNYEVQAVWNNQCGNGVSQMVNFRPPCHVVNIGETVHACGSYVWIDSTYTESGTYLHEYWNADDCWQVDTLHLTIGHVNAAIDEIEACDSYTWINGVTYTESTQTPVFTLTNSELCDSVVTLHLTIKHSSSSIDSVVACDSFTWLDNVTYTESTQEPTMVYTNAEGCDSVVTLHLTIKHSSSSIDSVTTCDSFTWVDGVTYTESTQEPTFHYTNAEGCDSLVTLHLTILRSSFSIDTVVSCSPYTWLDDSTYTESTDVPTMIYENAIGCDSIVHLHLIMLQATAYTDTVVACDSLTWLDGVTYTESVQGPVVYFTDVIGCDNATVTLDLTILHSSSSIDSVVVCDSLTWLDGITYTESTNEPSMVYTNSVGCDSVVTLHLTVHHSVYQVEEHVVCDSFTWINDSTYTENTDTPTMTYTSASGCDSVVTLHLVVNHSVETDDYLTICANELPYPYADTVFDVNTPHLSTFNFQFSTSEGCDSLVTLHLTVNPSYETEDILTICENELPYTYGDTVFDLSTTHLSTILFQFSTVDGCDSLVTLHLTVNETSSSIDSVFATEPYTWIDGVTYSESIEGPSVTLTNEWGCDSVVTLYLTIGEGIGAYQAQRQLVVWPNPTRGQLNMSLSGVVPETDMDVNVYDMYGRLLYTQKWQPDQTTLDLSTFAQGIYLVKVYDAKNLIGTAKISKLAN